MPDALRRDQFLSWANGLVHRQTPAWLGLPTHAEKVLLTNRGAEMVSKLLKMQMIEDDEDVATIEADPSDEAHAGAPAWMRTLRVSADEWLKLLPQQLLPLRRTADNIKRPLYRFFEREVAAGVAILNRVKLDLTDVTMICKVNLKTSLILQTE